MKKQHQSLIAITVFGFLTLASLAMAQRNSANRMAAGDTTFVTKAAQGGMAEVQMGQLAKEHAANQAVKNFGQKMIEDHTRINNELKQIATNKGIALPTGLDSKDQSTYDRLSKLNGPAFDKAYLEDMVRDHRADITEFNHEADRGTDPDLKAFAAKTLPTLEGHLQLAETTLNEVKMTKQ
jgi:putative membrane protein